MVKGAFKGKGNTWLIFKALTATIYAIDKLPQKELRIWLNAADMTVLTIKDTEASNQDGYYKIGKKVPAFLMGVLIAPNNINPVSSCMNRELTEAAILKFRNGYGAPKKDPLNKLNTLPELKKENALREKDKDLFKPDGPGR